MAADPASEPDPEPTHSADLAETWNFAKGKAAPAPLYREQAKTATQMYGPNPMGYYSGVSVEGNQVPPHPPKTFGGKPATMTWTGFERSRTGSRVFFQLNAEAPHAVKQAGRVLTLRIRNTRIQQRNNMRDLDLRYFKTPVETVKIRRRGKDVVITITLKETTSPVVSWSESPGSDYKLLLVDFEDARPAATATGPAPSP